MTDHVGQAAALADGRDFVSSELVVESDEHISDAVSETIASVCQSIAD
jgi:hypothetical protein